MRSMTAIVRFSYVVAVLFCSALVAAQPVAQAQDYADAAGEITVVDLYAKAPSSNIGDRSGFVAQVTLSRTQDSTYGGNINCDTKPGQKPDEYVECVGDPSIKFRIALRTVKDFTISIQDVGGATVEYGSITMKDQKNMNCDTTTLGPDTVYCSPVRVPISLALTAQS